MGSVSRGDSGTAPGNRRLRRLRSGRCEGLCGNLCEDICGKTSSRPSIATGPRGGTRTVRSGMVPVEVESIPLRWEKDRCGAIKTVCCAQEMCRVPEMEKHRLSFISGKDLRGFARKMCLEMKNTADFFISGKVPDKTKTCQWHVMYCYIAICRKTLYTFHVEENPTYH